MKIKYIWVTIAFSIAATIMVTETYAQYRRYPSRSYSGGYYSSRPRVMIGIGGVLGVGRWGGYYGGSRVGVSIMLPPIVIGARIATLPPGARRVYYGGVPYYYRGSQYYRERADGNGYEVVEAPLGATVNRLPAGARKRVINKQVYYEYNGTYYMRVDNDAENVSYIIVGRDGRLDTEDALRQRSDNRYDDDSFYENDIQNDDSYNRRLPDNNEDEIIVRNANEDEEPRRANDKESKTVNPNQDAVYTTGPQVGDRFENLPRSSKTIKLNGETRYVSPAGTEYKEVTENGKIVYEVVKSK
ncbi:MAG: DUF6515 family protein [Niabella sp.]